MVYSHIDRIITGSAVPVHKTLKLTAGEELRAAYFLERRELGVINIGAMALSSLFCMYGMLLPTVAGPLFFNESFSLLQGLGVVLMILAIFFSVDVRQEDSSVGRTWLAFALITMFFSGMVGVFEKVYQTGPDKGDIHSFLSCAFVLIALFNAVALPVVRKQELQPLFFKKGLLIAILTGLVVMFYNRINLILAGALDTMIYYPISSGGAVLLTLIVSVSVFKETLRRNHIICFICGTVAILLLGIC